MQSFEQVFAATPHEHRLEPKRLLALDPGETTGVALFEDRKLISANQIGTGNMQLAPRFIANLFKECQPDFVVFEDYRVYAWKKDQHSWAALHTPRLIGGIETLLNLAGTPFHKQMANLAKGFATDDKLRAWDMYEKGQKHARDAIRHGIYFLLFNKQGKGILG